MNFTPEAVSTLQSTVMVDLRRFTPELVLIGTILAVLLLRMVLKSNRFHLGTIALSGAMIALLSWAVPALGLLWPAPERGPAFGALLVVDPFGSFLRGLLLAFLLLAVVLTRLTNRPDKEDSADFYVLLFGAVLGLMVMTTSNHLLMVIVGIEMASLPGYVLAGFRKGQRRAAEGSLKYVLFGAAAAAIMVYGISLIASAYGSASLPTILTKLTAEANAGTISPLASVGGLLLLVGLLFKLGAVPFHLWLPDVFEGAGAEVGAMLAVASKIAAAGLLMRLVHTVSVAAPQQSFAVLAPTLAVAAMLTMTLGNLAAYRQTNLKRLLGYSTIAHAGYILAAIACLGNEASSAILVYLSGYLLMNLGAFAAVAIVEAANGTDTVAGIRGLWKQSPGLTIGFAVCIASLLGLPPFAGFVAKFQIFREVCRTATETGGTVYLVLFGVALLNAILSAGYYLSLIRTLFLDEPSEAEPAKPIAGGAVGFVLFLAVLLTMLGLAWGQLAEAAKAAGLHAQTTWGPISR